MSKVINIIDSKTGTVDKNVTTVMKAKFPTKGIADDVLFEKIIGDRNKYATAKNLYNEAIQNGKIK